jgi:hypothetical protein
MTFRRPEPLDGKVGFADAGKNGKPCGSHNAHFIASLYH